MRWEWKIISIFTTLLKDYVWLRLFLINRDHMEGCQGFLAMGVEYVMFLFLGVKGGSKNEASKQEKEKKLEGLETIFKEFLSP